jgi:ATP-dependent DNA helicase RecG
MAGRLSQISQTAAIGSSNKEKGPDDDTRRCGDRQRAGCARSSQAPHRLAAVDAQAWLDAPVTAVDGVSARVASTLAEAFEIRNVRELLEHYPHQGRYRDIGVHKPISQTLEGEPVTVVGTITGWQVQRPRRSGRRLVIARATLVDDEGGRVEVPFFNQEWRAQRHPAGTRVAVSGTLERFRSALQLRNPQLVELASGTLPADHDRIHPTYPATESLPAPRLARLIHAALDRLPPLEDWLPDHLRERHQLVGLDTALRSIHRPRELGEVGPARRRLVYDELLCRQIGLQQRRSRLESEAVGIAQPPEGGGLADAFLRNLPFEPTRAQRRAMDEIGFDLARAKPMHRLLQGDVGTGKTLVAVWAMLVAVDAGHQAVLMAPTEVLAEQHFTTVSRLLAPLGVNVLDGPRLELLTGSTGAKRLRGLLAELAVGDIQLLIGTHALLEERVQLPELGFVVVDEQHRFGVEHRARLRDKRSDRRSPDVLVATATPIPRSLALTVYGDLDVTVLDERPEAVDVATVVLPADSLRRAKLYEHVRRRAAIGERTYVVCPTIEESEALGVRGAEEMHRHLSTDVFPDLGVGLVHGRLPAAERDAVMDAFRRGETPVLVATTVIEVGLDVPEATVMIVEDANRFGLSQLHQLRGRLFRGLPDCYCVLFSTEPDDNPRLQAMAESADGFRLAEVDLELRGEGSLFDTRQSGLPDLKLARLARDVEWIARARADARALVEDDPDLKAWPALRAEVTRRYGEERLAALRTG